ncbi:uncharacterized protein ATNIH1004_010497 [Aspergillus tanneri]|uniref:Glucose-methanol-choline oxidoreductase N-terminal domain-containing protein n=1 Tax=Aspergillus tanneri TaxID=1220188 RepID=A0A5M9MFH5_9EURO|nr:uncharacterized protein ATNIH1004_010497 [Aspergillus tanneri]KAA8643723.1 hypothetical protein ATNIH1004_010497 [Aspergillus tanneri]
MAIKTNIPFTADYVIIGGGTAGLTLASRLSENSTESIVVLEAGSNLLEDPRAALGNRVIKEPQGKLLGGPSGPLKVSFPAAIQDPLCRAWVDTFKATGHGITADPFSGKSTGGYSNLSAVDSETKTRSYAASAYGRSPMERPNVHIVTEALVQRILFKGLKESSVTAGGIEAVIQGEIHTITANKEVIVCAGALNTPKLLELSGIGNKEILHQYNIHVVVNSPSVGENLQDHLMSGISFEVVNGVVTGDPLLRQEPEAVQAAMQLYMEHKTGPMTIRGVQSSSYMPLVYFQGQNMLLGPFRVPSLENL